jgi:hypothetical protein
MIPAFERGKAVHALDGEATVVGAAREGSAKLSHVM